jgi:hypothetical protein
MQFPLNLNDWKLRVAIAPDMLRQPRVRKEAGGEKDGPVQHA